MSTDDGERDVNDAESHVCMGCEKVPSQGWENGWRFRFCHACAARIRDCNGEPLDYSPDTNDGAYELEFARAQAEGSGT